jgi:hypothetical protein
VKKNSLLIYYFLLVLEKKMEAKKESDSKMENVGRLKMNVIKKMLHQTFKDSTMHGKCFVLS